MTKLTKLKFKSSFKILYRGSSVYIFEKITKIIKESRIDLVLKAVLKIDK